MDFKCLQHFFSIHCVYRKKLKIFKTNFYILFTVYSVQNYSTKTKKNPKKWWRKQNVAFCVAHCVWEMMIFNVSFYKHIHTHTYMNIFLFIFFHFEGKVWVPVMFSAVDILSFRDGCSLVLLCFNRWDFVRKDLLGSDYFADAAVSILFSYFSLPATLIW